MKKARPSPARAAKDSDIKQAVGGQPENDQDAREAGLSSATSTSRSKSKPSGARRPPGAAGRAGRKR